jgi:hypothetical protein
MNMHGAGRKIKFILMLIFIPLGGLMGLFLTAVGVDAVVHLYWNPAKDNSLYFITLYLFSFFFLLSLVAGARELWEAMGMMVARLKESLKHWRKD